MSSACRHMVLCLMASCDSLYPCSHCGQWLRISYARQHAVKYFLPTGPWRKAVDGLHLDPRPLLGDYLRTPWGRGGGAQGRGWKVVLRWFVLTTSPWCCRLEHDTTAVERRT